MDKLFTYFIQDGVRRAKAAQLCGKETIAAQFKEDGVVFDVPLANLRSPKEHIETLSVRGLSWDKILRATQSNAILPPIIITEVGYGIPLVDVVIGSDEETLDDFRQRYGQ